jgi:putative integral membrane protein (TIGR02587 family)
MNENVPHLTDRPIAESLQEYGRGVAGGFLFSLPLLYTMEVWWSGFVLHPGRLVVGVAATFILLLGYNRYAGLRSGASFAEVVIDSVEELGLGLLLATSMLWLLGRITSDMRVEEIMGKS